MKNYQTKTKDLKSILKNTNNSHQSKKTVHFEEVKSDETVNYLNEIITIHLEEIKKEHPVNKKAAKENKAKNINVITSKKDLEDIENALMKGEVSNIRVLNLSPVAEFIDDARLENILFAVAQTSHNLKTLSLAGCHQITDIGLVNLNFLEQLENLNLAGCNKITDAAFANLDYCKKLQNVDLEGCDNISREILDKIDKITKINWSASLVFYEEREQKYIANLEQEEAATNKEEAQNERGGESSVQFLFCKKLLPKEKKPLIPVELSPSKSINAPSAIATNSKVCCCAIS